MIRHIVKPDGNLWTGIKDTPDVSVCFANVGRKPIVVNVLHLKSGETVFRVRLPVARPRKKAPPAQAQLRSQF